MKSRIHISISVIFVISVLFTALVLHARSKGNVPQISETEAGRLLILPQNLTTHLDSEFPGFRIPDEKDFDPKMLRYYNRNLIGVHPAITWGDFNGDKKRDYAILLVTGESPWGPQIDLIVLNGKKRKGKFETFNLGEVYGYKDDYMSFRGNKLYKGNFKKDGWYINWDKKKKEYKVIKP